MAAPTVTATSSASAGNGTNMTISVPSHSNGDLLVWKYIDGDNDATFSNGSVITLPAGWTQIGSTLQANIAGFYVQMAAFYRIASSEPSTYTSTDGNAFTSSASVMYSISGAENPGTTPIVFASLSDGASGTASAPTITPTDADSLVIRTAFTGRTSAGGVTPPTGYTEVLDARTIKGIWSGHAVKAASATGAETFTYTPTWWSSPAWGHIALAIAPTGGGSSTSPYYYNLQQTG